MVAHVALLRRLPATMDYFDYSVPTELQHDLKAGSIVIVPFRRQKLTGVVLSLATSSEQQSLSAVADVTPWSLTDQQLHILQSLSKQYFTSTSTLLPLFLPPLPRRQTTTESLSLVDLRDLPTEEGPSTQWLIYDDWNTLATNCRKNFSSNGQTLVVIPEYYLLALAQSITQDHPTLIIPLKKDRRNFWSAWLQSRQAPVMIGTFHSLFLPFQHLRNVIILDAENTQFHRSEQSPRLHLADLLSSFQQLYKCHILLASPSPNCNLFQALRGNEMTVKSIEHKKSKVTTVDRSQEYESGKLSLLSPQAVEAVEQSAHSLLYLNHYGTANMVHCQRCQWVATCDFCQRALSFNPTSKKLDCWNCRRTQPAVISCARCGSNKLKLRSSGLSRLVKEVQQTFPSKTVKLLSSRVSDSKLSSDIIIATSKIISTTLTFDTIVAVNPDNELWRPDFMATEELRRHLRQLLVRCQSLIIQTANPKHYVYQSITQFKNFIAEELTFRQEFSYPPFVSSFKIWLKDKRSANQISEEIKIRINAQSDVAIVTSDPRYLVIRGNVSPAFIDNIQKNYNNKILIEINPYQWN